MNKITRELLIVNKYKELLSSKYTNKKYQKDGKAILTQEDMEKVMSLWIKSYLLTYDRVIKNVNTDNTPNNQIDIFVEIKRIEEKYGIEVVK